MPRTIRAMTITKSLVIKRIIKVKCIAKSIAVVGLASLSVYAYLNSGGEIGPGWAIIAVLILFFAPCEDK